MTTSKAPFRNAVGGSRSPLRINPAVVIGLGDFGGATLHLLAGRLKPTHPTLVDAMGWLWLTTSGWRESPLSDVPPEPSSESAAPIAIPPEPLAQALDQATSRVTAGALRREGYHVGATLDTFVVGRVDDPLTREALWRLLELMRTQPPLAEIRVTLILACDSRRFAGPSAPTSARFFDALAERLVADSENGTPGAVAWCYLCDTLNVDSRLVGSGGGLREVVAAQSALVGGFLALLIGSDARRNRPYLRTAVSQLMQDASSPRDAALVGSFGWGAYVLPIEQIVAVACDQLALRLHTIAFPPRASGADQEAAFAARERLVSVIDLSPQGLRDRLLEGPDGAPIRFDTTPPDLSDLDPKARLKALTRWCKGLESRWVDEETAPPAQIARNADALLDELNKRVQTRVTGLLQDDRRGIHRSLAFLDELPQIIEEARVHTLADDSYYIKMTVPSVDQKLRELAKLVTGGGSRRWREPISVSLIFALLVVLSLWLRPLVWPYLLGLWLMVLVILWAREPISRRRGMEKRQSEFISAVRRKYHTELEREMRVERRGLFDAFLSAVRQERGSVLAWQKTVARAKEALTTAGVPPFEPGCGERPLCEPADYPSPLESYDEDRTAELAAQLLDSTSQPYPREDSAASIVAWLRDGAAQALDDWAKSISVAHWGNPEPSEVIAQLTAIIHPQLPLAPDERRQVEVNVVGLPEPDASVLSKVDTPGQMVAVSTSDAARIIYAPTRHGLRLKDLAFMQPLWKTPVKTDRLPDRDAIHKTFIWHYAPSGEPERHHVNLVLSRPRYQAFRAEPRPPRGHWLDMVAAFAPELDTLADGFEALHRQRSWPLLEAASNVLVFTQQCIAFDTDRRAALTGDWPRYPLETLVEGIGGSEDRVILAAAVLMRLGYDVALLHYRYHCALGIPGAEEVPGTFVRHPQTGVKFFYGETTGDGWSIGQVPPEYHGVPPEDIEVFGKG